jgi:CheY-like chemotaxis protein
MKILIVDETETVAALLADRLGGELKPTTGSQHMHVDRQANYARAVELLRNGNPYDVVIVEPLPLEQAEELGMAIIAQAKRGGAVPIVLTAAWRMDRCVRYMRAGAWDVLSKARPMGELVTALVDSLLEGLGVRDVPDVHASWVSRQLVDLCRRYPGQWIAVDGEREIVINSETYDMLIERMKVSPPNLDLKIWRLPIAWTEHEPDF